MAKFQKIDKEFLLSDDSVNCYGFRLLTSGYNLAEFQKNPIGYYMHVREGGVLVKWEDLAIRDGAVYGKPVINMSNARGQQTVDEIENGFLNAASVGHLVIQEFSDDPKLKLPDQTGPTVTKWYNRECSPVDIPGNMNALALYDKDENPMNLADLTNPINFSMKKIFLSAGMITVLNLKAEDTDAVTETAFNDLVAKAAKVADLEAKLLVADQSITSKTAELATLKASAVTDKQIQLVDNAITAKKIDLGDKDKYLKLAAADFETTKSLIEGLKAYTGIEKDLGAGAGAAALAESVALMALSGDQLYKTGKFEALKAINPEGYKAKFKECFGVLPE